jgi:predicted HicB family RNase H-like nuclease
MLRESGGQGGNEVATRLDVHRYAAAEALANAQRQTLRQLVEEAIGLAVARGSTR